MARFETRKFGDDEYKIRLVTLFGVEFEVGCVSEIRHTADNCNAFTEGDEEYMTNVLLFTHDIDLWLNADDKTLMLTEINEYYNENDN